MRLPERFFAYPRVWCHLRKTYPMDQTTGTLLRLIITANLSVAAHKLATVILDGIAWKDGFNGLERGTAAFTLAELGAKVGVSRQYLNTLLTELETSPLGLIRWRPKGRHSPWLFRFSLGSPQSGTPDLASAEGDNTLYRESHNKTVFSGRIKIGAEPNVHRTPWAALIRAVKTTLPCWNIDVQVIWERFLAFNSAKGNTAVPAGFLLGFMRKWRAMPGEAQKASEPVPEPAAVPPNVAEAQALARPAPSGNRDFHRQDLERLIGRVAYEVRIAAMMERLNLGRFAATLAVHGQAVKAREIGA